MDANNDDNLGNSVENNSHKESEDDIAATKKYISEIARLQALLKSREAQIENLTKKLDEKGDIVRRTPSESDSDDQDKSELSNFIPTHHRSKEEPNVRKRGRPRSVLKRSMSSKKSRGRPRKSIVDEHSSNSEPVEKKGRGRPRKFSSRLFESQRKKSRGRPRKSIVNDDSSASLKKDTDSEAKVRRSRGRPRKTPIPHDQSSNSGLDPKHEDEDSTIDDSEPHAPPKEKRPAGRPRKYPSGVAKTESLDSDQATHKRQRGRPRKTTTGVAAESQEEGEPKEKRGRGRPKSNILKPALVLENTTEENSSTADKTPSRGRGRPKKNKIEVAAVEETAESA